MITDINILREILHDWVNNASHESLSDLVKYLEIEDTKYCRKHNIVHGHASCWKCNIEKLEEAKRKLLEED